MTAPRPVRWDVAGMLGVPLTLMTVYLLWIWPRPRGSSAFAELAPYLIALIAGLPFAWRSAPAPQRKLVLTLYLVGGITALWLYALLVLCGVRGVCL